MEKRELTCIGCPMGCLISVELENGEIKSVSGHTCARGEIYAKKEVTHPTRIVTTTVKVKNGTRERVSCKTAEDIPKAKIAQIMEEINAVTVAAPVKIGDVLIANAADTGVAVIATANVREQR